MNQLIDEKTPRWRQAYSAERAGLYDRFIQAAAMHYDEALQAVIEMAQRGAKAPARILELGAGTGGLTALLLNRFPEASVLAVDGSPEMLDQARGKLAGAGKRLDFKCMPFEDLCEGFPAEQKFDLIVSSFSLHHMDHDRLRGLFAHARRLLAPGGQLIVADYVLSSSPELQEKYEDVWVEYRLGNMRRLGDAMAKDAAVRLHEETKRAEGDNPAELERLLLWLREASFRAVDCHWKYFCYAVYGGTV